MITISKDCADITKEWKGVAGDDIKLHAWQVPLDVDLDPTRTMATGKLVIERNGQQIHEAEIPWMMHRGDMFLALQVYTLSTKPRYSNPEFQKAMEAFAERCDGFEKPSGLYWTREPLL